MKENRIQRINELLDNRQTDLTVLMDQVHKSHNLAAIVRTGDAIGVGEIHAVQASGNVRQCGGTAMGSNRWVTTHVHKTLDEGITTVKSQGMQVLAAHFSDRAKDFRDIDYTKPTCILVGAEKYGVSDEAADAADHHILIPMVGMVQSLNVSVAAALVLYEAQRQRKDAGMYGKRTIADDVAERLTFEWLHDDIKEFCLRHDIRYPRINEAGDIDDEEWQAMRKAISGLK
ncbi:tRNA (guanosine(18)-2'-O)-methyltransferase TrmH [Pleionea sp. CnH1-48]|uniref:tRNA (guanosine(18)-2'-O)-methyltransferase TrmH n=1 Tax=Pleionea sp. CnH1-48 TaxID=2954494 RepID=UPI00209760F4|nr:tRNA (guanosine(18)-2'-O)-methyltransferase TrmH [Pleionea sp. CnH1-48]MCO7224577.1 tRNA (guanosine(18)-2'-O)-methyltransferase TrmH [Pleionea sp. CnH1-48]